MSKRHKLLQKSKTNCALLKAPPGALNVEAGKGNMQMLISFA